MLVRSKPLRSFDSDVVDRIITLMRESITIMTGVTPISIKRTEAGKLLVSYSTGDEEEFDTVLAAVGER